MDRLFTMTKISSPTQYATQAYLIIGLQVSISLLLIVFGSRFYGQRVGLSLACGGLAVILPTVYFALKVFYRIQRKDSKTQLYHFYGGQIVKLFLSISLSLFMLIGLHVALIPFIIGFLSTQLSVFLVPLMQTILRIVSF